MEQLFPAGNWFFMSLFSVLMVWSIVWKGFALWRAARNQHLTWFICMLIFNTAGILEIIYIFGFSKKKKPEIVQ